MAIQLKNISTFFLVFSFIALNSQTVLNLQLTDSNKIPLSYAIIKYRGITHISNSAGSLRISNFLAGSKIEIHKLGFEDKTISVATTQPGDSLNLNVVLSLKISALPEIVVNSTAIKEVNPLKTDFVLGYELKGDYLIELLSDDNIIVIDRDNKVKFRSRSIAKTNDILKDAHGNIHITTDKNAFKINPDNSLLRLDTLPTDLAKLYWNIQYCDEAVDTSVYIRRYKDINQTVAFFAISRLHDRHVRLLKEISDIERKNAVTSFANEARSFNQYVADLGLSKMTASNEGEMKLVRKAQGLADRLEMTYSLPAYSFLKQVNDSIYLFAHDLDSMFVFDKSWNLVKSKRILYHHLKIWGKELFVNEEKTQVYARLTENSKPMIAEVDLQTGILKEPFLTIGSRFPSRLRVRNNILYYMTKQKSGIGYTIYSQSMR